MDDIITSLPLSVCGTLEKYSDTMSKGRVRVFYRGLNRNGTFITDEFAQELIASAPYTPIKGIYVEDDYTDHGKARSEGRIYGIVPFNANFAWEKHLDEDGVEREYACFDALFYTALYPEASEAVGKGQSMELYKQTLSGHWALVNGQKALIFEHGCFLGLQILGDAVTPCFEGSSFYTLQEVENINLQLEQLQRDAFQKQGGERMSKVKILPGAEKLWEKLNTNFTEELGWAIDYTVCSLQEDSAIVYNSTEERFEKILFTKNEEGEISEITETTVVCAFMLEEDESKVAAKLTEELGSFAKVQEALNENATVIATLSEEKSEFERKKVEFENNISTLTIENDSLKTKNQELEESNLGYTQQIETLTNEKAVLAEFKKTIEDNEKKAIIANYVGQVSEEVISKFTENMDSYTAIELDMQLTYEQKLSNPTVFSHQETISTGRVLKDDFDTGLSSILSKYEKH